MDFSIELRNQELVKCPERKYQVKGRNSCGSCKQTEKQ